MVGLDLGLYLILVLSEIFFHRSVFVVLMPIQIDFVVGEFCKKVRDIVAFCMRFYLKSLAFKKIPGFSFDLMVGGALILHQFSILKV